MSHIETDYQIVLRDAQPYIAISTHVRMESVPTVANQLPKVFAHLASTNTRPAGAPFFLYRSINMASESVIEVGVPIASEAQVPGDNTDGIIAGILPAGRYVEMTHIGDPSELRHVTQQMLEWAAERRLQWDVTRGDDGGTSAESWACRLEWYETDPREEPDRSKWRTRLALKLAGES